MQCLNYPLVLRGSPTGRSTRREKSIVSPGVWGPETATPSPKIRLIPSTLSLSPPKSPKLVGAPRAAKLAYHSAAAVITNYDRLPILRYARGCCELCAAQSLIETDRRKNEMADKINRIDIITFRTPLRVI